MHTFRDIPQQMKQTVNTVHLPSNFMCGLPVTQPAERSYTRRKYYHT